MKAKEVLEILKITRPTLCKYVKCGKIKAIKLGGGQYDYDEASIYEFLGKPYVIKDDRLSIIYARTSNPPKKYVEDQSQRLLQFCTCKGIQVDKILTDIKSGMNFERKGLIELIDLVCANKVKLIIIENKDRLCRFGFDLIKTIFSKFGCEILVANDISDKNFEQELTEDLLSIIHYFSMKSYSNRRKLNKIKQELLDADS